MSVKGKVYTITGAASGIGLETAKLFASKGAKVSLADIQEKPLQDLEAELKKCGAEVMIRVVDVSKRADVDSWIADTVDHFGKIDGAANLAGVIGKQSSVATIEQIEDEDWDFIMGVNITGLRNCLRAQVPHMNKGGAILNAASVLGLVGAPKQLAYCASKHAIVGMTRSAAKELGPKGIRVNCICPGPVDTPMMRKCFEQRGAAVDYSWLPLGRAAHQKEVPPMIEFLLTDASSFITGNAMPIDASIKVMRGHFIAYNSKLSVRWYGSRVRVRYVRVRLPGASSSGDNIKLDLKSIAYIGESNMTSIDQPLAGKILLITGGASGIGLSVTKQAHDLGTRVLVADIKTTPDFDTFAAGKSNILYVQTDVTRWPDLNKLFDECEKKWNDVPDAYAICAGLFDPPFSNFWQDPEQVHGYMQVDVNVNHPIKLTRLAIKKSLGKGKRASVCIIASVAGISGNMAAPMYCATKHAMVGFVKSLASTEPLTGVKVTTLCPAAVLTPLFDAQKLKQFSVHTDRALTPEACATQLLELLQKRDYPCGSVLEITMTGTRLIPEWGVQPPEGVGLGRNLDEESFMTNMLQPIKEKLDSERAKM
ncbi:3-oxoacyl-[acyl-carrier- ] reductase [Pyrenophora seminiperda CCB06]|uniref:3-oxoacyl-[acyl-carrier-] reductase n=1 Tax=Pyrenophora seminiperda CCB06 TaxID=1302712 RepID=A0A3M7M559_9PLEO|nr:3-oxoacyl-[acyl-carrier- ] reductase [Pyrenophora seminiperda CCB06]